MEKIGKSIDENHPDFGTSNKFDFKNVGSPDEVVRKIQDEWTIEKAGQTTAANIEKAKIAAKIRLNGNKVSRYRVIKDACMFSHELIF